MMKYYIIGAILIISGAISVIIIRANESINNKWVLVSGAVILIGAIFKIFTFIKGYRAMKELDNKFHKTMNSIRNSF